VTDLRPDDLDSQSLGVLSKLCESGQEAGCAGIGKLAQLPVLNRAEAIIRAASLQRNIESVRNLTTAKILVVLKADAYGHGISVMAPELERIGVDYFGTALLEEAVRIRQLGIRTPIMAWLTPPGTDFVSAIAHDIELSVPSPEALREISLAAHIVGKRAKIHVEVDSGMVRGGVLGDLAPLIAALKTTPNVDIVGTWTHFARASEPSEPFTDYQLGRFRDAVAQLRRAGLDPGMLHTSNSAAILTRKDAAMDMVRLGISTYGLTPDVDAMGPPQELGITPVMELVARVHLVKDVPAGSPVGYSGTAVTRRDTRIAVIPLGYSDGIPWSTDATAYVWAGRRRAYVLGRVSMDQFVVDLGPDSDVRAGDEVIVWGPGKHGEATMDTWAKAARSLNYELAVRLGNRIPRILR
jgi:alanine racemase